MHFSQSKLEVAQVSTEQARGGLGCILDDVAEAANERENFGTEEFNLRILGDKFRPSHALDHRVVVQEDGRSASQWRGARSGGRRVA